MENKETIEEAAKRLCNFSLSERVGFYKCFDWQEERSYSDEDMISFGDWCRNGLLNTEYSFDRLNEHLEQWKQFKNK